MNTRSLKFQLLAWYACVLIACFVFLGAVTYLALENSLVSALKESQLRRARQVVQLLRSDAEHHKPEQIEEDVEARYAPGQNGRFVRVSQLDGVLLYVSKSPSDQSFDPASLPPPIWNGAREETTRQVPLLGGRKMLLTAHPLVMQGGGQYLVETGAPMDEVQSNLRHWLMVLVLVFPILVTIALAGGYFLVNRALTPVDKIAASAQRISSHNLSERLPVPGTGDELERLSVALNHMIERLDSAFQYSRRFIADASHELRTPLTILRGELESLVQESRSTSEWRERVGSALEEVERLTGIVEGLFAISRLDAGEAQAESVSFDLGQLAATTADQMGLLAIDKHISISVDAQKSVTVEGDRARLKQVIVNLLDNAIKYTPPNGWVRLRVRAENGIAWLEVSDNGAGIPDEALPHIFERFYRVDKTRSRAPGGAGLGLSIVKSICTAHGAEIQVQSRPGLGSQFRVKLPLARGAEHLKTATIETNAFEDSQFSNQSQATH